MTHYLYCNECKSSVCKFNYKHYCPDWDFMLIEDGDPEFECCTCYNNPEYKEN